MNKRELKSQETKKALDEAINKLIIKKNIKEITIKDICGEAGVAVGTFYNYYQTKEDLVWCSLRNIDDYIIFISEERLNKESLKENLCEFCKYYCYYIELKGVDFIKQAVVSKIKSTYENKCEDGALVSIVNKLVKKAQENGEISKDKGCEEISEFIVASIRGRVFQWCLSEGNYDLYNKVMILINVMLKGLK